ncbi:tRNA (adenosine(37)-N6)-threonylcarbamoyltransferase complex dimerization subunit type 1 TsaB [Bacillus carboniphilus]|uniref:tRNA (Adenosine(37)-N6)-threonylcarbamoyltransferase complex dimerization subunit type 1 TsaB n=1 Tax=Bacillus carboniphilus TaxID=86663 RepID=A0ABY9JUP0_9BACI|nr:tRNA (adenosine(37)-N6)-threonylcarbamoyltransferase complex dimerization subunit type 1 TsaB [Bacillus carboniphilus]WLR42152.1 tRNA (adenosine(37)-N6)-threonylcarbamoyltransferase complex dimerization subunit type 1 TsaB [Bacillus carboniphilus]
MNVLAIDTSNETLGVAISKDKKIIAESITTVKKNHSVRAMPTIVQLLADCDIHPKQLDRIVVAKGPGSYTGVRIGMTIAKTMAWSLKIPIVAVSSLQVMAMNGHFFKGKLSPLLDARRGNVYTGLYSFNDRLYVEKEDQNVSLSKWLHELKEEQEERILFIGKDTVQFEDEIRSILGNKAFFTNEVLHNARPSSLLKVSELQEPGEVHSLTPNYIRLAEAEAKWLAENKMKS